MSSSSLQNNPLDAREALESSPLDDFVAEIRKLARSLDPALAAVLGNDPDAGPSEPWTGDRRRGLSLCLAMLRYARVEVASGRQSETIDRAIDHVVDALERLSLNGGRDRA